MAGLSKPNISNLGPEVTNYTINGSSTSSGSDAHNLFDGIIGNTAYASSGPYSWARFAYDTDYIDISIPKKFNLWVHPALNQAVPGGVLNIKKYVDYTWVNVGVEQYAPLNGVWSKTCENMEAGRYKFEVYASMRTDSEWYIEEVVVNKFLIKQEEKYYTLKSEYYSNGKFTPLTLSGGTVPNQQDYNNFGFDSISLFTSSMTINTETFIPINKFNLGCKVYKYSNNIESLEYTKIGKAFLIQDNNQCKSTDGSTLTSAENLPYNTTVFNQYGLSDLSKINNIVVSKLNDQKYKLSMLKVK